MANSTKKTGNRFLKLAGMTASIASKAVTSGIKSINADEQQKAESRAELMKEVGLQIADTLGGMKGAVMKVGQIASQYKDIFPPEVSEALAKLQNDAPPMPFALIKKQVEAELGMPINQAYSKFDEQAFASASIGQVHRATLPNGHHVVVKVQYPDVDKSCESDLKQVRMALKLTGLLKIDKKLQDAIFAEMKNSLYDELDYTKEAHNLAVFRAFHAPLDTGLIIPQVIDSHSTRRVLTLSEENGESLKTASTWSDEVKTTIAERLFHMMASQLFQLRKIHCDPHAGNFAFRENGDVVVYDFGATKTYSEDEINVFKRVVKHALKNDTTALEQDLKTLKVRVEDDVNIPGEFYQEWIDVLAHTLKIDEAYDFGTSNIHKRAVKTLKKSTKYWDSFKPSSKTMMLDRTVSGFYWNLVGLQAKAQLSDKIDNYVN